MLLTQYSAWPHRFVLPLHGGQLLLIDGHLLSKCQAVSGNCIHLLSGAMEIKVNSNTKHLPSTSSIVSIISATRFCPSEDCNAGKKRSTYAARHPTFRQSCALFGSSGYLKWLINWRWIQLLRKKAFACECCSVTVGLGGRGSALHTHTLPWSPELAQWPLFPLSHREHKPSTGESLDSVSMPICFLYSTSPKGWTSLWWTHSS